MQRVSLLGLGLMGAGLARNLLRAGFPLTVYNRSPEKAQPVLDQGARWAPSPRAAAENGALAIECSTLSLEWVQEWYAQVWARGLQAVDAPLFGSKGAAADGSVAVYVGAEPAAFEAALPVLRAFAGAVTRLGPPTAGTVYKLINNMMSGVHLAVLGEAVALAERAGLDMPAVRAAISVGSASSPMVKGRQPMVAGRQYTDVHFALRWMHKDLNYALRLGEEFEVPLPTASAARDMFRLALLRGLGDLDAAAEAELVRGA